eukprot:NODE_10_length_61504_cov_0.956502.p56 type:complete len:107 gc:universal NODE_10_length_61504_cov_0.956502:25813-25493(-)
MNRPLVVTNSFIEGIPVNIKTPIKINQTGERVKNLTSFYLSSSLNFDLGGTEQEFWRRYLKSSALHTQCISIAMQIHNDSFTKNHKYIAHQIAVLYVIRFNLAGNP